MRIADQTLRIRLKELKDDMDHFLESQRKSKGREGQWIKGPNEKPHRQSMFVLQQYQAEWLILITKGRSDKSRRSQISDLPSTYSTGPLRYNNIYKSIAAPNLLSAQRVMSPGLL
jgi:hypothetical protein